MFVRRAIFFVAFVAVSLGAAGRVRAQADELTYAEYRRIAESTLRLKHTAMYEPVDGEHGMNVVVGDRFGQINVYHLEPGGGSERLWKSRTLAGQVDEVLVADLDGDGLDDSILARTPAQIYVFRLDGFQMAFESLTNDYQVIHCFTVANVDEDPAQEIILNADQKIHYIDGVNFSRDWTSLQNYEATRIQVGEVDGDGRPELVLNTGQVLDSASGAVKWEDEVFGSRLELLDFDGDGIMEVMTESDGLPIKVYDIDYRTEKRFQ
jgi:hypothetical protein